MFKSPPFEVCSLMSGKAKIVTFLDSAKNSAPQYFNKCPYVGVHSGSNIMFLDKFLSIFPSRTFKLKISLSDSVVEIFKLLIDYKVY